MVDTGRGYATPHSGKTMTIAQWWASPGHAANMLLPGCKGIASAVSRSGRYYWTMEIGQLAFREASAGGIELVMRPWPISRLRRAL